jgi:hypothetical protein
MVSADWSGHLFNFKCKRHGNNLTITLKKPVSLGCNKAYVWRMWHPRPKYQAVRSFAVTCHCPGCESRKTWILKGQDFTVIEVKYPTER